MAKKLITQLKKHPQIKAFQYVADDAIEIVEAICLILPPKVKLLGLIRESGKSFYAENIEDYPLMVDIPQSEYSGFGLGFSIEFQIEAHLIDFMKKSRIPDYKQRIEQLNYSFGRYIRNSNETDQDHWSLGLECQVDKDNPMILHISFFSDDSTY